MRKTRRKPSVTDAYRVRLCLRFLIAVTLASMGSGACAGQISDVIEFATVTVDATRRSGEPVPGVKLVLFIGGGIRAFGETDEDGRHVFEFVPPNLYGVNTGLPPGYVRPEDLLGGPTTAFIDGLEIQEGDRKRVSFTYLKVGPGRIEVTVAEPDGTPVEETLVTLFSPLAVVEEEEVGPTGKIVFDPVPFGNWGIRVAPPDVYLDEGEPYPFEQGIFIEEGSVAEVSFTLERCEGDLNVRVLDESGGSVADHPMILYRATGVVEEGRTGSGGERAFGPLPCGNYGVALVRIPGWEFDGGRGTGFFDGIQVTRGSSQDFTFHVERCEAVIRASVVDGTGAPVAGASVTLYTAQEVLAVKDSDAGGLAVFTKVACGVEYGVRVTPPEGFSVEEGRGSSFFDGLDPSNGEEFAVIFRLDRL